MPVHNGLLLRHTRNQTVLLVIILLVSDEVILVHAFLHFSHVTHPTHKVLSRDLLVKQLSVHLLLILAHGLSLVLGVQLHNGSVERTILVQSSQVALLVELHLQTPVVQVFLVLSQLRFLLLVSHGFISQLLLVPLNDVHHLGEALALCLPHIALVLLHHLVVELVEIRQVLQTLLVPVIVVAEVIEFLVLFVLHLVHELVLLVLHVLQPSGLFQILSHGLSETHHLLLLCVD